MAGVTWAAPVLTTVFTPAAAVSFPVTTSNEVGLSELNPPPAVIGNATSNTAILFWPETCTTLAAPLTVDRDGSSGTFSGTGNPAHTIPAGTFVCSYFFRSERVGPSGRLVASLEFSGTIIGVALENDGLGNSNILGSPGTNYADDQPYENNDFYTIGTGGGGGSTFAVDMFTNGANGSDNIRVIVVP